MSALHQLHLHSRLNIWLQRIGQRQCKTRRETFKFRDMVRLIFDVWRCLFFYHVCFLKHTQELLIHIRLNRVSAMGKDLFQQYVKRALIWVTYTLKCVFISRVHWRIVVDIYLLLNTFCFNQRVLKIFFFLHITYFDLITPQWTFYRILVNKISVVYVIFNVEYASSSCMNSISTSVMYF